MKKLLTIAFGAAAPSAFHRMSGHPFPTARLSPWLRVLAAATVLMPFAASAQIVSGNDAVRVEVRVQSDQDRKDI